jgi:uncharacterized protein YutE (UPF0331/DUF86 family)
MTLDEKKLLIMELDLLKKSSEMLKHSYQNCVNIGKKDIYSLDELEKFEALTSRFARTSDIVIQKIFRIIDRIELEFDGSVIDRINRAEKRGIIESAEAFKSMRRLRNQIAHEYMPSAVEEMFRVVLDKTPLLLEGVDRIQTYCQALSEGANDV